ncbi:AraC family transcriptional regulator [Streptomyces sp. NBC_01224]|uniref:AraC family transcriptional regulator n=1 Tax=Streptomyces sp. NBC_01224 TaxID=2903783 RepID=UPI002E15429E|nr:AraC family transcriptional regulator [Streptomyces sp. NBC_01224]
MSRSNRRFTVDAVAHRWGFSSPSHFSRTFRGAYGMSPRYLFRGPATGPLASGPGMTVSPCRTR